MNVDPILPLSAGAFSAGLLCLSARAKLRAPLRFRAALQAQSLLPTRATAFFARLIAPLELSAALLAAGAFLAYESVFGLRLIALAACGALYLGFAAALTMNLLRGRRDLDCGCFLSVEAQAAPEGLSYWQVARNLALALSLLSLALPAARETTLLDYGTAAGAATLFALILAARSEMAAVWRRAEVRI